MENRRAIPVLACLALLPFTGFAQRIAVSGGLDTGAIMIGQQFHMKLRVEQPANLTVLWPEWNDTIVKGVEIVDMGKTDTVFSANKDRITFTRDYLLTSFDSGAYVLPPAMFMATSGRDTERVFTDPLFLKVDKPAVDTTKGIRDIKGPVEIPFDWREFLPYILAGFGIVGVIVLIVFLLLRHLRKRRERLALIPVPTAPPVPPHIVALGALEALDKKQLWQQGRTKNYYTELTDILRDYIRDVYKINAPEMLTDEILQHLKFKEISGEHRHTLRTVLELADMVKFAKVQPSGVENTRSLETTVAFVQETAGRDGSEKPEEKGKKTEKGGADEH